MRTVVAMFILSVCAAAHGQVLGFSCVSRPDDEHHVWRYTFEIDKQTNNGVWSGLTLADIPFNRDIEVVFTPQRMNIRELGNHEFNGYIDRTNLRFNIGGAVGSCKIVPVPKKNTKF